MAVILASDACFALGVLAGVLGTLVIVAGTLLWLARPTVEDYEDAHLLAAAGATARSNEVAL